MGRGAILLFSGSDYPYSTEEVEKKPLFEFWPPSMVLCGGLRFSGGEDPREDNMVGLHGYFSISIVVSMPRSGGVLDLSGLAIVYLPAPALDNLQAFSRQCWQPGVLPASPITGRNSATSIIIVAPIRCDARDFAVSVRNAGWQNQIITDMLYDDQWPVETYWRSISRTVSSCFVFPGGVRLPCVGRWM